MSIELIRPSDGMAGYFGIDFYTENEETELSIQFLIRKSSWVFGVQKSWWDGPIWKIGFGPIFLVGYRN